LYCIVPTVVSERKSNRKKSGLGKKKNPKQNKKNKQWQLGYQYWHVEADAVYALFNDSDFADGFTDARGHLWGLSYGLKDNMSVGVSYIDSLMFMDSADPIDYDRILVDLNYWFK
jgi:hypothetical protein